MPIIYGLCFFFFQFSFNGESNWRKQWKLHLSSVELKRVLMIHLPGPNQELKDWLHFFPTSSTHLPQPDVDERRPVPLKQEEVAYFEPEKNLGGAEQSHWDSSSSFDTPTNEDSSENQARAGGQADDSTLTEEWGIEIVSLLTSCAESISTGNHRATAYFLSRLGELASPRGSPIHRVSAYFAEALALRAAKLWPGIFTLYPPREFSDRNDDSDDGTALRLLNQVSPIPKFIHFTLNERLLRAFEGKSRVHIIDFDIKEGLQWPSLLQSLAARPNPPLHVRITGIGGSRQELQDTGVRLRGLAESLNLPFEFHPVIDRLEDVRLWMLHVKENECVAVNCVLQLHKVLYDDNRGALMDLLGLVRSTNPSVLLVAEEEAEHNDARWESRFASSLRYYSAVFDSLQSSLLPEDSPARIMIEEMLARSIRNIVGCEGRERAERHERFSRWQDMMAGGGFGNVCFGENEVIQSRMLLRLYSSGGSYSVEVRGGCGGEGLTLKFLDQPLYTVSAWAPAGSAGCSSASRLG